MPPKKKAAAKKTEKVADEENVQEPPKPPPKKRGRKAAVVEEEVDDPKDAVPSPPKRGRRAKAVEAPAEAEAEEVPAPTLRRGRPRKLPAEEEISNGKAEKVREKSRAKSKAKVEPAKKSGRKKAAESKTEAKPEADEEKSFYDFSANTINGEEISLDKYRGNVLIVVNVASKCGHTKAHYEQLVELYDKYSPSKGLEILAFPCNQFGSQEPGDADKICKFVEARNVKFDMFEKISVNGKNAHPLWQWLKEQKAGPKGKPEITWNFTKFIIDKEGNVVERFQPTVKPLEMLDTLQKLW